MAAEKMIMGTRKCGGDGQDERREMEKKHIPKMAMASRDTSKSSECERERGRHEGRELRMNSVNKRQNEIAREKLLNF